MHTYVCTYAQERFGDPLEELLAQMRADPRRAGGREVGERDGGCVPTRRVHGGAGVRGRDSAVWDGAAALCACRMGLLAPTNTGIGAIMPGAR